MAMQKTALQTGPVERLATGFTFVEGPVWHRDGHWHFSDIPESRIHTVTPSGEVGVHRDPSGQSNGLTLDGAGACWPANTAIDASLQPTGPIRYPSWPMRLRVNVSTVQTI